MFYKQLANGKYRYYQKYYDEMEGKWKQVTTTLPSKSRAIQAQAKKILDEKIESRINIPIEKPKHLTINDVREEWLAIRWVELKESTYRRQLSQFDCFIRQFGEFKLSKITSYQLQQYLLKNDWSIGYRNLTKVILARFFSYCQDVGYIKENPFDKVILPKRKKTLDEIRKQREKYLTRSQMKEFLSYLEKNKKNKTFRLMAEFMYLTGLRVGETIALRWSDIDKENDTLKVQHTLSYRKRGEYYLSSPKTINAYRTVLFNRRTKELLSLLRKTAGEEDFVFSFHGKPVCIASFNSYLKINFIQSNIVKSSDFRLTSHVLRHSHISLLAELNVPIKLVMERVGHSDEKTTLGIYTHVTENMQDDLRQKLDTID